MSKYLLRLDDASEYMDIKKWIRIEKLLDAYNIKPIVGVIPDNQDPDMTLVYSRDKQFWKKVQRWKEKDWNIALHGYTHVFETNDGGLNPINNRSEFAGVPLNRQKEKIRKGMAVLENHNIHPNVFFAPAHTFDSNTLKALLEESNIRIISDTIANDVYYECGFYFIPQQSGAVRTLPFHIVTFCYHPNIMSENDFKMLEVFLSKNKNKFAKIQDLSFSFRNRNILDKLAYILYFLRRKINGLYKV